MTTTEQRLRDALSAKAAQVRDDRLRPLPGSAAAPAGVVRTAAVGRELPRAAGNGDALARTPPQEWLPQE